MMMMRQLNNFSKIPLPTPSLRYSFTQRSPTKKKRIPKARQPRKQTKYVKPTRLSVSDSPSESLRKHFVATLTELSIRLLSRVAPKWENRINKCVCFTHNCKARLMRHLLFDRQCGFSYQKHFCGEKEEIVSLSKVIGSSMAALIFYMGGLVIVQQFPAIANPDVKAVREDFEMALELQSNNHSSMVSSLREENEETFRSMEIQREESDEKFKRMEEELKSLKTWTVVLLKSMEDLKKL